MNKRGRPPVLDDAKRREILAILSMGCSQAAAADYVGCSISTIRRTLERDPLFAQSLGRARGNAELGLVRNIRTAADTGKYWRAAAWALERFFPARYNPGALQTITSEQLAQVITRLAEMIVQQVPAERYRKNILKEVDALLRNLGQTAARETDPDVEPAKTKRLPSAQTETQTAEPKIVSDASH